MAQSLSVRVVDCRWDEFAPDAGRQLDRALRQSSAVLDSLQQTAMRLTGRGASLTHVQMVFGVAIDPLMLPEDVDYWLQRVIGNGRALAARAGGSAVVVLIQNYAISAFMLPADGRAVAAAIAA